MVKLNEQEKKQQAQENVSKETVTEKKVAKKEVKAVKKVAHEQINLTLEDLNVVYFPFVTEKAVNMIDAENKLTFIINDKKTKHDVKKVIEEAYKVKVDKINIIRDRRGRKKAIVRLAKEFKAQDLATKLGVL
ncbi:MAG: 50S ribosomal protein L23 [archaeon]|jgi:ribosomal protein uL23